MSANFSNSSVVLIASSKLARQRQVAANSPAVVSTASFNLGGKIGKEIRHAAIFSAREEIRQALANGNFRPLAQFLALQFGESVYLTNKNDFYALEGRMQTFVDSAKSGKNLGMRINKKTGEETISAKLADALELQSFVRSLIAESKEAAEAAKAARESANTETTETEIAA